MKKLLSFAIAILLSVNLMADNELRCMNNRYYYGSESISQSEMLDWYAQHNCQAAYDQFAKGQKMMKTGWALLGVGVALDIAATGCAIRGLTTMVCPVRDSETSQKPASEETYTLNTQQKLFISAGVIGTAAFACEVACIPTLVIGYHKMHDSANVYNTMCTTAKAKPYWSVQTSPNGLGLALKF